MQSLKQSVADWCFYHQEDKPEEYYRRLRNMGYEGVEMVPLERWQSAREAGLILVNLSAPGMQVGLNRKENHPELFKQIRSLIKTAQENQVKHLIIFSGNRDGQPDEEGLRNTILAGKQLAGDAESAGIVLALELLNSFDHADYQADSLDYVFEFARAVSSPVVKVLVDLYHLQRMGGIDLPRILDHLELIAHIHIAGSPRRDFPGGSPSRMVTTQEDQDPGQEIDFAPIVKAIHQAGYCGFWGQEFLPGKDRFDELARARELFDHYAGVVARGSG